jgi:hypothetical protein
MLQWFLGGSKLVLGAEQVVCYASVWREADCWINRCWVGSRWLDRQLFGGKQNVG